MQLFHSQHIVHRVFGIRYIRHVFQVNLRYPWTSSTNTLLDGWNGFAFISVEDWGTLDKYALILHGLNGLAGIDVRTQHHNSFNRYVWAEHHAPANQLLLRPLLFDLREVDTTRVVSFFGTHHDHWGTWGGLWILLESFFRMKLLVTPLTIWRVQSCSLFYLRRALHVFLWPTSLLTPLLPNLCARDLNHLLSLVPLTPLPLDFNIQLHLWRLWHLRPQFLALLLSLIQQSWLICRQFICLIDQLFRLWRYCLPSCLTPCTVLGGGCTRCWSQVDRIALRIGAFQLTW